MPVRIANSAAVSVHGDLPQPANILAGLRGDRLQQMGTAPHVSHSRPLSGRVPSRPSRCSLSRSASVSMMSPRYGRRSRPAKASDKRLWGECENNGPALTPIQSSTADDARDCEINREVSRYTDFIVHLLRFEFGVVSLDMTMAIFIEYVSAWIVALLLTAVTAAGPPTSTQWATKCLVVSAAQSG